MATAAMTAFSHLHLPLIDDFHLHLRDGEAMEGLVADLPATVARAIIMPNLKPPVVTTGDALRYRERILAARAAAGAPPFQPLMTLYLTDGTTPDEISRARDSGLVFAVKYYPAGATTNSDSGVTDIRRVYPVLARMAEVGLPLLVHGEVTDASVDVFEREPAFIECELRGLVGAFPELKIVLEHITTKEAVAFVDAAGANVAATVTAHHLLYNRNALFEGGVRPHRYCLPVLKHESDRAALLAAVLRGSGRYFAGTDSAPHARGVKECACGAAGMFTAHAAVELYATALGRDAGVAAAGPAALQAALRHFMCEAGADFYGLPRNAAAGPAAASAVQLRRETWRVPASYRFGPAAEVVPVLAGQDLHWRATVGVAAAGEAAGAAAAPSPPST